VSKQRLDPSNIKDLEIFSVEPVSSENKLSQACVPMLLEIDGRRELQLSLLITETLPLAVHGVPILESP